MIFSKKKIIFFILAICLLISFKSFVYAQDSSIQECKDNNKTVDECPAYLQSKINLLLGQAETLVSQIAIMDSQINLTQARIEANKKEILDLTLDIDTATKKISTLSDSLNRIAEVLINRIIATYKAGRVRPLEILLSSSDASNLLARLNYLKIARDHDKKLLIDVQQTKSDFTKQKEIFETKKKKVESLKLQLEAYTNQLEQGKQVKRELLIVTENDENKYRKLLDEAESILRALSNVGVKIGDVKRGDVIASVGNTGCSTGSHLHFEVYEKAKVQGGEVVDKDTGNPIQFQISDHLVNPLNYINSGQFNHPLPESIITTGFKEQYFRGSHTGVDFAYLFSDRVTRGQSILAAESGVAYSTQDSKLCSGFEANGIGRGIVIDHQNGLVTLYWHIQ
ncbi:MAG: Peptidase [Candidatus Levybacteria bacterium]|nr:Peptidase [Candidatus Levybacteria bacterium]